MDQVGTISVPMPRIMSEVIRAHVLMPRHDELAYTVTNAHFASNLNLKFDVDTHLVPLVRREGSEYFIFTQPKAKDFHPGILRVMQEIMSGDLRVEPQSSGGAVIWRRALPDRIVDEHDAPANFLPVAALEKVYHIPSRDMLPGLQSTVADILSRLNMTIRKGATLVCTDGILRYLAVPRVTPLAPGEGADGSRVRETDWVEIENGKCCTGPDHTPIDYQDPGIDTTYTWSTGVTIREAKTLATRMACVLRRWTGNDAVSSRNLLLMPASPFLRTHAQHIYYLMGNGGKGKSTVAIDERQHLGPLSCTFSMDLLGQPSALSAENQMLELCQHVFALCDDFDPRYGRFEKIMPNLKTLATGTLPFSARLQGQDAIHDVSPQSVLVVTSNFMPAISDNEEDQRRFAMAVISNTMGFWSEYLGSLRQHGFWPVMLASAMEWVSSEGQHLRGIAYVNPADLSDEDLTVITEVIRNGFAEPTAHPGTSWRKLGLIRRSRRVGKRTVHVYMPPNESNPLHSKWLACRAELERLDRESGVAIVHTWDLSPLPGDPIQQMTDSGVSGDLFALKGGDDYSTAKQPAVRSWKSLLSVGIGVRAHGDKTPMQGFCPDENWMVLDLDVPKGTDANLPDGCDLIQLMAGPLGSPDGMGDPALVVRTAGGGLHLYYRIPQGFMPKNAAHLLRGKPVFENGPVYQAGAPIDVRVGRKGYVVAPGSACAHGSWDVVRLGAPDGTHTLPAGVADLCRKLGLAENTAQISRTSSLKSSTRRIPTTREQVKADPVPEGSRHDTCRDQAWGQAALCREKGLGQDEVDRRMNIVRERFQASGLPSKTIEDCIRSATQKQGFIYHV